jgi:diaminohydroxyphosphoribosylaminopyrimidine deaminase/5-amino-6-(5-phosphoribosylamino)uracil reductase
VILDSTLRTPLQARILQRGAGGDVLIYTSCEDDERHSALRALGATVEVFPGVGGEVDLAAVMNDLGKHGFNEVLVEAGATLNGALLRSGLVDELLLYVAPQLLGDAARGVAQLGDLDTLDESVRLEWMDVRRVGDDMRVQMKVNNV